MPHEIQKVLYYNHLNSWNYPTLYTSLSSSPKQGYQNHNGLGRQPIFGLFDNSPPRKRRKLEEPQDTVKNSPVFRDPVYFYDDADSWIIVQNTLFKVGFLDFLLSISDGL